MACVITDWHANLVMLVQSHVVGSKSRNKSDLYSHFQSIIGLNSKYCSHNLCAIKFSSGLLGRNGRKVAKSGRFDPRAYDGSRRLGRTDWVEPTVGRGDRLWVEVTGSR